MIPKFAFVNQKLSGFLLVFVHAALRVGDRPDRVIWAGSSDVGPEYGAVFEVLGRVPEQFWSEDGNVIGIEEEGFGEAGVDHGGGFELV